MFKSLCKETAKTHYWLCIFCLDVFYVTRRRSFRSSRILHNFSFSREIAPPFLISDTLLWEIIRIATYVALMALKRLDVLTVVLLNIQDFWKHRAWEGITFRRNINNNFPVDKTQKSDNLNFKKRLVCKFKQHILNLKLS